MSALFEAVFEQIHIERTVASAQAAEDVPDALESLARSFEWFLDAVLEAAVTSGRLVVDDPETVTRLLFGALTRGAMLIANSATPDATRTALTRGAMLIANSATPDATRTAVAQGMRALLGGFVAP